MLKEFQSITRPCLLRQTSSQSSGIFRNLLILRRVYSIRTEITSSTIYQYQIIKLRQRPTAETNEAEYSRKSGNETNNIHKTLIIYFVGITEGVKSNGES